MAFLAAVQTIKKKLETASNFLCPYDGDYAQKKFVGIIISTKGRQRMRYFKLSSEQARAISQAHNTPGVTRTLALRHRRVGGVTYILRGAAIITEMDGIFLRTPDGDLQERIFRKAFET